MYYYVINDFRFAVKMAIDQMVIGEVESLEELQEYMEEYAKDWYIGNDTDPEWERSIIESKPMLFSMKRETTQVSLDIHKMTKCSKYIFIWALTECIERIRKIHRMP